MAETATETNPTGVPMQMDNTRGMWLPGEHGTQVQVNPSFSNIGNVSGNIGVGTGDNNNANFMNGGQAGTPRQIEVVHVDEETTPAVEAPAETPEAPVPTVEERLQQMQDQLNQLTQAIEQLVAQMQANQAPAAVEAIEPAEPVEPAEPEPIPEPGPNHPELVQQALEAVQAARAGLIDVTIRRRARSGDGLTQNRRVDEATYNTAMEQYRVTMDNYLTTLRNQLEAPDPEAELPSEEQIRTALTAAMYAEQREFINQEYTRNNELLDEAGWRGRFLRRWANVSTRNKILIGLGVGLAAGVGSGALGLGLAGLAAGSAVKFSLGLINRRASARNVSEHSRDQELRRVTNAGNQTPMLELPGDPDPEVDASEAYRTALVDRIQDDLDGRVQHAQRRNRIGNGVMIASGLVAAYGLADLAGGVPHTPSFSEFWHGGGGHHSTGGNTPYDGQHGSGANQPYHDGNGGPSGGGAHNIEYAGSGRITGVDLPPGMDLIHTPNGHLALYDSINHREIINGGSLPKGLFDTQGNISAAGREFLRGRGFNLDQMTKLSGRFMTTINRA